MPMYAHYTRELGKALKQLTLAEDRYSKILERWSKAYERVWTTCHHTDSFDAMCPKCEAWEDAWNRLCSRQQAEVSMWEAEVADLRCSRANYEP